MNPHDVLRSIQGKPTVHELCYGAFLQEALPIGENCFAIPFIALGFGAQAEFAIQYASEIIGLPFDKAGRMETYSQGSSANPTVGIIAIASLDAEPAVMEDTVSDTLDIARRVLAWSSGDRVIPFARIVKNSQGSHFRLLLPHTRRRQRLGFGNTGSDYENQLSRISECAGSDRHFAYALAMFGDAQAERDPLFKAARMFTVLECLAQHVLSQIAKHPISKEWKKKKGGKIGSRTAIKVMLGLPAGATMQVAVNGEQYSYDPIEIGGRIRDSLYHGDEVIPDDVKNADYKRLWKFVLDNPDQIVDSLDSYCNLEIARWANNASIGRAASEGYPIEINIEL